MAKKSKVAPEVQTTPEVQVAPEVQATPENLPYALIRELEEIMHNTGQEIDLNQDLSVLEKICNQANRPSDAWRNRWN